MTTDIEARYAFDEKIVEAFKEDVMDDVGYDDWDEVVEDHGFDNAGKVIAHAMITGIGPYPDAFDQLGLRDNLQGLEEITFVVSEGRPAYQMVVDRVPEVTIIVFETDDGFDLEITG